ncbi:hypothetical protein FQR65_LT09143 [Abscondita terminalis]|nr:hypothetical protein FQR65_LT09143 [Abscondita terminalis]
MENTIVFHNNLSKICRTCLVQYEDMHSIFSEIQNEDNLKVESMSLYEILTNISSIRILADDGLPTMICTNCMELAHASFKFQQQCNRSQEILEGCILHAKVCELQDQSDKNEEKVYNLDPNLLSTNQVLLSDPCEVNEITDELMLPYERIKDSNDTIEPEIKIEESMRDKSSDSCQSDNLEEINNVSSAEENLELDERPISKKGKQARYFIKVKENGDKLFECTYCGKAYKHVNSLKVHLLSHTTERPYVCNHCGKGFNKYGGLTYHLRSHTGEQPYACNICGKRYRQSGTLTAHMRIHTGQRPFLCSVCGRGFRQAPDLGYHMRTHTKERPYMCNVCGKTMRMQCHLVQHLRIHTGERPFKCTECSKAFPSSTRLKRHAIIHTGLKPYTCDVCKKAFNRLSTLKVHSKIHTDERPHVCSFCGKGFIQAHALKTHMHLHCDEELPN